MLVKGATGEFEPKLCVSALKLLYQPYTPLGDVLTISNTWGSMSGRRSLQDLFQPRSREIRSNLYLFALKFDRHPSSSADKMPVEFQSDAIPITCNLGNSRRPSAWWIKVLAPLRWEMECVQNFHNIYIFSTYTCLSSCMQTLFSHVLYVDMPN